MTNDELIAHLTTAQHEIDTVIHALTPAPQTGVPRAYAALTDRTPRPKPPVQPLGAAGSRFTDPIFGSRLLRVTDGKTRPARLNYSFRVPSNAHTSAWNADGTRFYVISNDGSSHLFDFDAATMTATKHTPQGSDSDIRSYVEPQFSLNDPQILFGAGGYNARTLYKIHLDTGAYDVLLDLDTLGLPLANTYVGGVLSGGVPHERLLTFFGGGGQDAHDHLLLIDLDTGARTMINTVTTYGFHLHATQIDLSGRYVFMYPSGADRQANKAIEQVYIWDTQDNTTTAMSPAMHPAGHDAAGFGMWVNQDCCTASSWDAGQWQFRRLSAPAATSDLIVPIQTPQEVYMADHTNWRHAQPDALVPVISATYRYLGFDLPWRAWDDEILAIETATPGIAARVWRFCHHRSDVRQDANPNAQEFWYEPMVNVAPNGRWAIFTSNWEKSLGTDASDGLHRQDVFVCELKGA